MTKKDVFDEIRKRVGPGKISDITFLDHGSQTHHLGQQLGDGDYPENWLQPDDFYMILDLFAPITHVYLDGCGVGRPGYDEYLRKIANIVQGSVRATPLAERADDPVDPNKAARLVPQNAVPGREDAGYKWIGPDNRPVSAPMSPKEIETRKRGKQGGFIPQY